MPITRNHATSNTVSMMYAAIKDNDVELFRKVISLNGDIYDTKGNGTFFTRALSNQSRSLYEIYIEQPDFKDRVNQYHPHDFYYAIANGGLEELTLLASIGLKPTTLCIESILKDRKFVNSKKFLLKASILAFMISPSHYTSLKQKGLPDDLLLLALELKELELFDYIYENRVKMDVAPTNKSEEYIVSGMCYSRTDENAAFYDHAYKCLDRVIDNSILNEDEAEKITQRMLVGILRFGLNKFELQGESHGDSRGFFDHLITKHPDYIVTQQLGSHLYGLMLLDHPKYRDYLIKNRAFFSTLKVVVGKAPLSKIKDSVITNNDSECDYFSLEAKKVATASLRLILDDTGIDTSDILNTIQKTGRESKVTKQAIMVLAINEKGLGSTFAAFKHVSYLTAAIDLGFEPYEILTHVSDDKLAIKLSELMMDI